MQKIKMTRLGRSGKISGEYPNPAPKPLRLPTSPASEDALKKLFEKNTMPKPSRFEEAPKPSKWEKTENPWIAPCRHPEHRPPMHICIPHGMQYRHVCPGCGMETVIASKDILFHHEASCNE